MGILHKSAQFIGLPVAATGLTRLAFTSKRETVTTFPTTLTTDAINTTGANLLIVVVCDGTATAGTISDNKGNTFSLAGNRLANSPRVSIYYLTGTGTYGTGHTVTWSTGASACFPTIYVYAYSGATASPFLVFNSNISSSGLPVTSLSTNSITPAVNGALLITAFSTFPSSGAGNTPTISGGGFVDANRDAWFTNLGQRSMYSACYSIIQTTAAASNPTHGFNAWGGGTVAAIAAFK